MVFNSS